MRPTLRTLASAGMLVFSTGAVLAAPPNADHSFAVMAAQSGQAEQQLGQLAQQNAAMPLVRRFGQMLVTDYTSANDELQQIADQENLDLTAQQGGYQQALDRRLANLRGEAFDRAFLQREMGIQSTAMVRFQHEAQSGHDPALKDFARKTLPMLRQELRMAQSLSDQLPQGEDAWRGED